MLGAGCAPVMEELGCSYRAEEVFWLWVSRGWAPLSVVRGVCCLLAPLLLPTASQPASSCLGLGLFKGVVKSNAKRKSYASGLLRNRVLGRLQGHGSVPPARRRRKMPEGWIFLEHPSTARSAGEDKEHTGRFGM